MHKLVLLLMVFLSISANAAELAGGDVVGRNIFGLALDYQGDPVMLNDQPLIYEQGQFDADIELEEVSFRISTFNHQIGNIFVSQYDREQESFFDTISLNLSSIGGISHPVNPVNSSWNSVLLGERQLIDAANPKQFEQQFRAYFKQKGELVKPYNYGYGLELIVLNAKGDTKLIKNYAMGRVFPSHQVVMPDAKTIYLLDSENSGNLYLFIAEKPGSLVKGTLYVTELKNNRVKTVALGKTSALKMKLKLKRIDFPALFSKKEVTDGSCPSGYQIADSVYGKECLSTIKKNRRYSGLLEPVRVAALNGVRGFGKRLKAIRYVAESNVLQAVDNEGRELNLVLGSNEAQASDYIIQEPL